jgi:hypothetical protein
MSNSPVVVIRRKAGSKPASPAKAPSKPGKPGKSQPQAKAQKKPLVQTPGLNKAKLKPDAVAKAKTLIQSLAPPSAAGAAEEVHPPERALQQRPEVQLPRARHRRLPQRSPCFSSPKLRFYWGEREVELCVTRFLLSSAPPPDFRASRYHPLPQLRVARERSEVVDLMHPRRRQKSPSSVQVKSMSRLRGGLVSRRCTDVIPAPQPPALPVTLHSLLIGIRRIRRLHGLGAAPDHRESCFKTSGDHRRDIPCQAEFLQGKPRGKRDKFLPG